MVITNIRFWFDFVVPKYLDSTLLKLCELILPSVHFSGLHYGLILRTSLQRKTIHSNMLCYSQKWVVHWSFKFLVFTCCQKRSVEWYWIKLFRARFSCISVNVIAAAVTFVSNVWWTGQPSPTTSTLNGFTGADLGGCGWSDSPSLQPAKVTLFIMNLYNSENNIRDIRSFCLSLFCESKFVTNSYSSLVNP